MNIVLIGPPGCGKNIQGELLIKKYKLKLIDIGTLLRQEAKKNTKNGKEIKLLLDKGDLVPDEIPLNLVKKNSSKRNLFEGFPRTLNAAQKLDEILKIDHVFLIECRAETIIKRLSGRRSCKCGAVYHLLNKPPTAPGICDKCGSKLYTREDDKPEIIKHRIDVNNREIGKVIDFYKKKGVLHKINGEQSIEDVFSDILTAIKGN